MVAGGTGSLAIVASDEAVGDTAANLVPSAMAGEAGALPDVNLPSMYPQPNPFGLDAQGNYVGFDQSPALQSLIENMDPNVSKKVQGAAQ